MLLFSLRNADFLGLLRVREEERENELSSRSPPLTALQEHPLAFEFSSNCDRLRLQLGPQSTPERIV